MANQQKNTRHRSRFAFSLVDTVTSFFVIGVLILVFANLLTVRTVNRRVLFRTQAAAIANEELSALKRYDISSLPNQTNGSFLGTLYNAGGWTVVGDTTPGHGGVSALDTPAVSGFSNKVSSILQLPAGSYGDATLEATVKFSSDTAAGTAAGFFFRATDANNGYRLLVAPTGNDLDTTVGGQQNWILEKVVNGTVITPRIFSANVAGINLNSWNTIKIIASSTSLKNYLNGNGVDSGILTDADFTDGAAALIGWNGVHARFDDITTTVGLITSSWGFEGVTTLPTAWVRLGLNDLPDGTPKTFDDNGKLTLTAYPNTNSTTLKQATITITWSNNGSTGSYSTTALIGSSRIGQ